MRSARRLWQLTEPYHAVTYFAPEAHAAYKAIGLRGFWRGYFAGRAAPMGAVGPGPVIATFFGFRADFVRRAIPSVWSMATPPEAVDARLAGADAALRQALGGRCAGAEVAEAAEIARRAVTGCGTAGRPLFAANAELDWPEDPHLVLWHAATLLREHRGDGHVVALTRAGLDGTEAHVLRLASTGEPISSIQPYRGWDEGDWADATERLRSRGLVDGDGRATDRGRSMQDEVEDETDRLAAPPIERLGRHELDRLLSLLGPVAAALGDRLIPYPNPIGVPRPEPDPDLPAGGP